MCADCYWNTAEKTINSVPADFGCLCKCIGLDTYGGLMYSPQTVYDCLTITQSLGKEMHADGFMFANRMCQCLNFYRIETGKYKVLNKEEELLIIS